MGIKYLPFVKSLKFIAVDIRKTRCLIGAEQCPVAVGFNSLHEEIWDPESVEQVSSAIFFFAMVLSKIQPAKNVCVPGFEIDGKGTRTFVAALIDVASSRIVDTKHWNKAIRSSVCAANVGSSSSNAMNVQTDTTSALRNHGACLQCIVDAFDALSCR